MSPILTTRQATYQEGCLFFEKQLCLGHSIQEWLLPRGLLAPGDDGHAPLAQRELLGLSSARVLKSAFYSPIKR